MSSTFKSFTDLANALFTSEPTETRISSRLVESRVESMETCEETSIEEAPTQLSYAELRAIREAEEYQRLRAEALEIYPLLPNPSNTLIGTTAALRFTHTHPRYWSIEDTQRQVRDLVKWAYNSPRALLFGRKRTQDDVKVILDVFWNHPVHGLRSVAQARKEARETQEREAAEALDF